MSSRTNLRLQLMREQSMRQENSLNSSSNNSKMADPSQPGTSVSGSNPLNISKGHLSQNMATASAPSGRSAPIIISQPIQFKGNKLVHLPPQIIRVEAQGEDGVKRTVPIATGGGGVTESSYGGTPPKVLTKSEHVRVRTPQQGSRNSPAELSPPGYADSPHSASFTSAQSEIDDIIIDEILSLQDEQNRRRQQNSGFQYNNLPNSFTCSGDFGDGEGMSGEGGRVVTLGGDRGTDGVGYGRQVSSSAPSSTLDIDNIDTYNQQYHEFSNDPEDHSRDRRKKDIHNMIERRRRYNINDRIKELGTLLPKCSTDSFSELKLNKGTILKASVDYIRSLQREHDNAMRIAQKQQVLEQQNRSMAQRIKELEGQLHHNNVPIPTAPAPTTPQFNGPIGRIIKQEPPDEQGQMSPGGQQGGFFHATPPRMGLSPLQQRSITQPMTMENRQQQPNTLGGSQGHTPQEPVASPSVGATLGLSQLELDPHHTYAAAALSQQQFQPQPPQQSRQIHMGYDDSIVTPEMIYGQIGRSASNSGTADPNTVIGAADPSLETPPVQPLNRKPPLPPQQMHELMMDLHPEAAGQTLVNPMLHLSDPMLGVHSGGHEAGLSPEVHWDTQAFSPDGPAEQQMDLSG